MRTFFAITALAGLLSLCSFQCRKDDSPHVYKGKSVLNAGCGNLVIQVQDAGFPAGKMDQQWLDPLNDSVYTNVFTDSNVCDVRDAHLTTGDVISFELADAPVKEDGCIVCFWYRPAPHTSNVIKNVHKLN